MTDHLIPGVSENPFGCPVEKKDLVVQVYGNEGFIGVLDSPLNYRKLFDFILAGVHSFFHRFSPCRNPSQRRHPQIKLSLPGDFASLNACWDRLYSSA
jgi:hypothetical protein